LLSIRTVTQHSTKSDKAAYTGGRPRVAQRVEVDAKEVRIKGSKSVLLRMLVAAESAKTAGFDVPSFVPKWRARRDSNC
jgi:hypothetical protein